MSGAARCPCPGSGTKAEPSTGSRPQALTWQPRLPLSQAEIKGEGGSAREHQQWLRTRVLLGKPHQASQGSSPTSEGAADKAATSLRRLCPLLSAWDQAGGGASSAGGTMAGHPPGVPPPT